VTGLDLAVSSYTFSLSVNGFRMNLFPMVGRRCEGSIGSDAPGNVSCGTADSGVQVAPSVAWPTKWAGNTKRSRPISPVTGSN